MKNNVSKDANDIMTNLKKIKKEKGKRKLTLLPHHFHFQCTTLYKRKKERNLLNIFEIISTYLHLPSILAWRIPWTEEPDWLHSMGLQRVRHD